jgi:uncharacterized protein YyaL (SSP411 family)
MNRLSKERSPYLRHAAEQKIDWHPWSEEAFQKAIDLDRPLFLSSGAVWCHWCHVMAEESFEDEETARILNENFIAIKLDRDERPDLDRRYQNAVAAMGSGGGWPLSVFLTPDGIPFYGGTYFPPVDRPGMPGFTQVLLKVSAFYHSNKEKVYEHSKKLIKAISSEHGPPAEINKSLVDESVDRIMADFDSDNGGFGSAPKFPMTGAMDLLISRYFFSGNNHLKIIINKTLEAMAKGGFYDQLGGGFHRYSVDAAWIVPHFEKMASDNAGLLVNYIEAYALYKDPLLKETSYGIINYINSTLSGTDGGFYSSQDADVTPDDEGGYFTWTMDEIKEALSEKEFEVISMHLTNDKGRMHHDSKKFVLFIAEGPEHVSAETGIPLEEVKKIIRKAKQKLLNVRNMREEPYIDKTLYTSLNGMLISSYLKAFRVLGDINLKTSALNSIKKILSLHYINGNLYHTDNVNGMLDDYIYFIDSLIIAYEATGDNNYIDIADRLMRKSLNDFWDKESGGFFDTDKDIIGVRLKTIEDIPSPSSNAVGIYSLLKLHYITGNDSYRNYAEKTLRLFSGTARGSAIHSSSYLLALDSFFNMLSLTVEDSPGSSLSDTAFSTFRPYKTISYGKRGNKVVIPCSSGKCYKPINKSSTLDSFIKKADLSGIDTTKSTM